MSKSSDEIRNSCIFALESYPPSMKTTCGFRRLRSLNLGICWECGIDTILGENGKRCLLKKGNVCVFRFS